MDSGKGLTVVMANKIKTIIMAGPPGSGKSTIISRMYTERIKKISTGDILRKEIKSGNRTGKKIKTSMDQGKLAPRSIVRTLISRSIDEKLDKKTDMFIFDGFPRDLKEIEYYFEMTRQKNLNLDAVIILKLSEEKIMSRVLNRRICPNCGAIYNIEKNNPFFSDADLEKRDGDNRETLKRQMREFKMNTVPAIEYFKQEHEDIILEQDAGLPVNQIMYEIFTGLNRKGITLFDGEKDE
jgi:adenylate kinase